jgi:curved DNA-binding protein CbpA
MPNERPDPYAILGVPPEATQAQISHAYRALLRRHHPDTRAPGDGASEALSDTALRQILAAYERLRDPTRRRNADDASASADSAPPRSEQTPTRGFPRGQPPIVVGPVLWYAGEPPRDAWREWIRQMTDVARAHGVTSSPLPARGRPR